MSYGSTHGTPEHSHRVTTPFDTVTFMNRPAHPAQPAMPRLTRRDTALISHIGLYGLSIHASLSELFFEGKQAGHVLKRLADGGLVTLHERTIPGGITYARLTATGCTVAGVPKTRSRPLGPGLDLAIAILYFSTLDGHRRYRVEHSDMFPFFGEDATPMQNIAHIASDELSTPCIFRVYHATGATSEIVHRLRTVIAKIEENSKIRAWMLTRHYGLAVLGQFRPKVEILRQATDRSGLSHQLPIVFGLGPTAETLNKSLRGRGGVTHE